MKFAKDYSEYHQDLDIVGSWIDAGIEAIRRVSGKSEAEAEEFVRSQPEFQNIHDTKINFLLQDKNGNRTRKQTSIVTYLERIASTDNVITPMFTSFVSKDKKEAPQPKYIKMKMAQRKKVKKAAQVASNEGNMVQATVLTGVQNAIKILINSFSGAALSAHNPFYSGSLHQVLCSMCRVSTAIATSLIERMLAGIRYYHKPSLVSDDLMQTIKRYDRTTVITAVKELGLKIPSKEECLEIIRRSYEDYWWEIEKEDEFLPLLDTMDDYERAAFAYSLDFYHIFKLNPEVVKKMVADITFNDYMTLDTDVPWIMDQLTGDETNFLTGLIGQDIKGAFLWDHLKEDSPKRPYINALAYRMKNRLTKYAILAQAFFLVDIMPLDVGNQDKAIRYATSLGDTDSSIFTTMLINEQFYGEAKFTPDQNPVTEFAIYLANGVIEHGLNTFTGQMNVHVDDRDRLVMKNEFGFTSLQMTPYKKTYFAKVRSCEGSVFADDNPKYEVKGARFHAGKSNKDMVKSLHSWMKEIPNKLAEGELIDRGELIDMIENIEEDIDDSLDKRADVKFSTVRIKEYANYSKPRSQGWEKHLLWNWAFGKTHGEGPETGYAAYKLPLKFEGGIEHVMEQVSPTFRNALDKYLDYVTEGDEKKRKTKSITYIPIPMDSMVNYGIPEELKPLIDLEKTKRTALDPFHLMLANMNIVMFKNNKSSGDNVVIQKNLKDILV